ncbi:hypothetical protein SPRG_06994 [Saprolegnia parasitica CBS 223.65]|uniref:4Fe-4S ferredoxin-type domain-containing protein n=1 Tax=Saprolegnia parasitica (strain CBS 223.65) TaxID=695850 RepID=A0A067CKU1_SAPPC|nr:hypothetical protein SPRG_06994 [Saprolegnia parasitica CBS 223.65]KDO27407.1 hypothetical protein SPRG_06994 [Saprolegnia parasitica CBS 223.65]|eukprot:XP_012201847.1 hypothetical protein SPRG_06994 [Saprolegnia parasitica CBS 223.65]
MARSGVAIVVLFVVGRLLRVHATDTFPNPTPEGKSWAPCASAVLAIAAQGDGSSPGSCMSCDPAQNKCPAKCQPLINTLYVDCDGVYSPPGLFFDPAAKIHGYWNGQVNVTRIAVERCGCNDALRTLHGSVALALAGTLWLLY